VVSSSDGECSAERLSLLGDEGGGDGAMGHERSVTTGGEPW
jgi:hypothetical protein